jgi:hypothetical protein
MINEISFVGVRMFNIINITLRFIKHIQNKFFGGLMLSWLVISIKHPYER